MSSLLLLSFKSLKSRKASVAITLVAFALSVFLVLGVERARTAVYEGFHNTVSKTDLIVGARTSPMQLLLYSIFHIGDPTNNLRWDTYRKIANHQEVKWAVPLSLGDSHKGYRVVGSNADFFRHYKYAGGQALGFSSGKAFDKLFDVVIGFDVAMGLGYKVGSEIVLAHGTGPVSFQKHADKPFRVVGVLKFSGTPVDKSVFVSLPAIEALHVDWQDGAPPRKGEEASVQSLLESSERDELQPKAITAFLLGVKSKLSIFYVQREINEFAGEPLTAILPGVALKSLWQVVGYVEQVLQVMGVLVMAVSLMCVLLVLLSSLNERRREICIYRSVGASKFFILSLILGEALLLAISGSALGVLVLQLVLFWGDQVLAGLIGFQIPLSGFRWRELLYLGLFILGSLLVGLIPAFRAYSLTLKDGLTPKN